MKNGQKLVSTGQVMWPVMTGKWLQSFAVTVICGHSHGWLWAVAVAVMAISEASVTDNDRSCDRPCETLQNEV